MRVIIILILLIHCSAFAEDIPTSLNLEESITFAIVHNQNVLSAKERIAAVGGQKLTAYSYFFPQVSAYGGLTRSSYLSNLSLGSSTKMPVFDAQGLPTGEYTYFPSFGFVSDREGNVYVGKISLQWPVWTWGRISGGYNLVLLSEQLTQEDYSRNISDAKLNVTQAFLSVILAEEVLKATIERNKSLATYIESVKKRYDEGLASKFDVLRSEVQLSNFQPLLLKAQNGAEIARMNFVTVLGLSPLLDIKLIGKLSYEDENFNSDSFINEALANRVEIKIGSLREKISDETIKIAWTGYRPSVALLGGYQWNRGQQFPPSDTIWQQGWDVGVGVNIPIFDGFATSGKIEEAQANLKQAKLANEQLVNLITMEVKSAYLNLKSAKESIFAQEKNIQQAQESLNIVKERYNLGMATNLEVLDTEMSLLQANTNYLQALYDYNLSKAKLKKSIGQF